MLVDLELLELIRYERHFLDFQVDSRNTDASKCLSFLNVQYTRS